MMVLLYIYCPCVHLDANFSVSHIHPILNFFIHSIQTIDTTLLTTQLPSNTTTVVFIPPSILIFASGFIFRDIYGPIIGVLIALISSYVGAILGGTIGFLRANYMTRDLIQILMRRYPILRAIDAAIVRNSLRVMILMRLNPLIPFGVLNYLFGISGVSWESFILAMVGVMPWHLWLICLGASANSVYDESTETSVMSIVLMGMGVAFGVIGLVITWRFARKELQKVSCCGVLGQMVVLDIAFCCVASLLPLHFFRPRRPATGGERPKGH